MISLQSYAVKMIVHVYVGVILSKKSGTYTRECFVQS